MYNLQSSKQIICKRPESLYLEHILECLEVVLPKPDSLPSENFLIRWLLKEKVVEKEVMTFLADFSKTELSV